MQSRSFAERLRVLWCLHQGRNGLRGPVLKERLGGVQVEGPGEQKALPAVALLALQDCELLGLLDALGERLDREVLAELHEGVQERLALLVVGQSRDERPVDLQRVDGELLEVSQR